MSTNGRWVAIPNTLIGGWVVTTCALPYHEHDHRPDGNPHKRGDREMGDIDCQTQFTAELVADLLNFKESSTEVTTAGRQPVSNTFGPDNPRNPLKLIKHEHIDLAITDHSWDTLTDEQKQRAIEQIAHTKFRRVEIGWTTWAHRFSESIWSASRDGFNLFLGRHELYVYWGPEIGDNQ